jgi:hypothetical protein
MEDLDCDLVVVFLVRVPEKSMSALSDLPGNLERVTSKS